jgi:hypothetical protein
MAAHLSAYGSRIVGGRSSNRIAASRLARELSGG